MNRNETLQQLLDGMGQFKRQIHAQFLGSFERLGLSPTQLELLKTIQYNQPMSHKALAAMVQLTPGAVSQLLDSLDREQCIVRTPDQADRRISYLSVSKIGKKKLEELAKIRKQFFTSAFDTLNDQELAAYLSAQQKILAWLENQPSNHKKPEA